ncbi:MAG: thioredoxin family protein [Flavobacteriales bacterium]|nr:thioredoxin family protein [Flavobacteriales bacterium]
MAVQTATDQDFNSLLGDNENVVVKFYADWCGNCRLFAPKYKRVSNEEEMQDVLFLDVNAEENPEKRKMAGVDNLPFMAFFKNGELVEGSSSSKEEYIRKIIDENR